MEESARPPFQLHFLLFLTVRGELRRQRLTGLTKKQAPTSRSALLVGSMLVLVSLLAVSLTSILYVNMEGYRLRSYLLAASLGFLGLLVFFLYVVASREKQAPSPVLQARNSTGKALPSPAALATVTGRDESEGLLDQGSTGLDLPRLEESPHGSRSQIFEAKIGDDETSPPPSDPSFTVTAV